MNSKLEKILLQAFEENHFSKKLIKKLRKIDISDLEPEDIAYLRCKHNLSFKLVKDEYREILCSLLKERIYNDVYSLLSNLENNFNVEDYKSVKIINFNEVFPPEIKELYEIAKKAIESSQYQNKFIDYLNSINKEYIFPYYPEFLDEVYKSVFPSIRQKLKGIDRLNRTYELLYYLTQKAYLEQEIIFEHHIAHKLINVIPHLTDENIVGFQWKLSTLDKEKEECIRASEVDYGLGKGVFPKDKFPLVPLRKDCACYLLPKVKRGY